MLNLRDISAYCVCTVHLWFLSGLVRINCLGVVIRSAMVAAVFHLTLFHVRYNSMNTYIVVA